MPLQTQKEIIHYNEMTDRIFDIDMNMWDIVINVIKPIIFHAFHRQSNSMIFI
jgi:hypothetical protein